MKVQTLSANDGYSDILVGAYLQEKVADTSLSSLSSGFRAEAAVSVSVSVSVKAFPNPVVNYLSVQLQGLDAKLSTYIRVINTQGVLVKVVKVGNIADGVLSVDVSGFIPGGHFVLVENGRNVFKEKEVKE
ncbi:hypothetical protein [Chitinophaga silvisoli]|uniref:T9SS C-terminal target domain-containing protein n=1 Tax=Chitinophaga silvisoli TaxID=2291814 RepID=A0A3E1NUZ9_9BACT|nr:hypothetical protein [Chitinophaga silvisoli]RFM31588.1 hypothetical protein DXN04_28145 [Chitinophaga silvisoli]